MLNRNNVKAKQAQGTTVRGSGIVKGNPRRCLFCRQPIRSSDKWTKQTSRDGAYSVIVHDRCNGKG
jgi:hypothetical protein